VAIAVAAGTLVITIAKKSSRHRHDRRCADRTEVVVEFETLPAVEESVTVVASTRTDTRLEDQPMRVEVLAREEIEEKMLMTPGDIVMMLNEMGGMRVQATSPSLGAASVRIQGMRGRYTRVLSDGLPLFGDVGGLGLLQIPPMDSGRSVIRARVGVYGADAMGVDQSALATTVAKPVREFLFNISISATDGSRFSPRRSLAAGCVAPGRRSLRDDESQRG
jgi:iron complex outermembrane receptor protein